MSTIRITLAFAISIAGASITQADTLTFVGEQSGPDFVMTISGSVDLNGFNFLSNDSSISGGFNHPSHRAAIGDGIRGNAVVYTIGAQGSNPLPAFGSTFLDPDSITGDTIGFSGQNPRGDFFAVPAGYQSSESVFATATWNNATAESLGFNPGNYSHSFLDNEATFTIVPEPGAAALLLLGALMVRGRRL
ncbi:hypothetical protein MalM25_28650 [Planctomycetes bacterium MalM25]|nr:hypothetical protein MalM25_28650 [Planctomycetes bacterium MalM25]